MKLCIISGAGLCKTHGTGAQLLRIFASGNTPFFHFYHSSGFGKSQYDRSFLLEDPRYWKPRRGKRLLTKIQQFLHLSWWQGNQVRKRLFRSLINSNQLKCDVAYVVVVDEREAQRGASLLEHLDCPYIVNIMDLLHPDGLVPNAMPGFKKLLENATSIVTLNPEIKAEVEKFKVKEVEVIPFCQEITSFATQPPSERGIRIVITGFVHQGSANFIADAWSKLTQRFPGIELVYLGPSFDRLPDSFKKIARYGGYVSDEEYQYTLATSHLAYLPGPIEMDCFGRFSIPSRLSDFFMAGLPVLANIAVGSATENFLKPLVPDCVHFTRTKKELLNAIESLTGSDEKWLNASQTARTFARSHLSEDIIRSRILEKLLISSQTV